MLLKHTLALFQPKPGQGDSAPRPDKAFQNLPGRGGEKPGSQKSRSAETKRRRNRWKERRSDSTFELRLSYTRDKRPLLCVQGTPASVSGLSTTMKMNGEPPETRHSHTSLSLQQYAHSSPAHLPAFNRHSPFLLCCRTEGGGVATFIANP